MRRTLTSVISLGVLWGALGLAGCASQQPGPVPPLVGEKAPGVLVMDPALAPYLDVPAGQQNYSHNAAGLLEYNTVVRNRGARAMTLAYNADFFDEANRLVEEQSPQRFFVDPQSEKALRITATDRRARIMRVQVRPAR